MEFNLAEIKSKENLKELFIEEWSWENPGSTSLSIDFPDEVKGKIDHFEILAEKLYCKVLLFTLKDIPKPEKELRPLERKILTNPDIKRMAGDTVFIFSFDNLNYFDFVRAEQVGTKLRIKRFSVSPDNRDKLRTPSEQLKNLALPGDIQIKPSIIRDRIDEAFKVEVLTEKFYDGYIGVFKDIKEFLSKQEVGQIENKEKKLKDFIHQILNRIMFLYFVQKRGCFANDKNFLANFWDKYKSQHKGKDEFHNKWLNVLFFEALCKQSWLYKDKQYLGDFNKVLKEAPYLNGGLFEEIELDDIGWKISDELFDEVFEFFEGYNFTVEESTPFEIDIEINPEMLGNVYEHLVNTEEKEEQAKAGIFYTPKTEIELMIRRSLVEFLFNKTGVSKEKLYQFVFAEEENREDGKVFTKKEAGDILKELEEIFILDPACGSGHYLVVITQVLYKLKEMLWEMTSEKHLGKYEEKKKLIEHNVYGNDIKYWAVQVAKLRLWLDLFVDADLKILKNQREPILPNLNFKIRFGDSLIQKIGKETVNIRRVKNLLVGGSKAEFLKKLIQKKKSVYESGGKEDCEATLNLEKRLLFDSISEEMINLQKEIQKVNAELARGGGFQGDFYKEEKEQKTLFEEQLKKKKVFLEEGLEQIKKYREELRKEKDPPMIWDLAFAEVFMMKNGFDIVIANPPYVRQEEISDLNDSYSKQEYKEKLLEQIKSDWWYDYKGDLISELCKQPIQIDKKSDLYVYFYLKGLKLLNEDGVLCYISSNSWLDVGYGAKFQEILLKNVPIIAIYDNQAKRSFAHADVNTIIALFSSPLVGEGKGLIHSSPLMREDTGGGGRMGLPHSNLVKFIMFKKPFEEIISAQTFIELEQNKDLKEFPEGKKRETEDYRLHIINQKDLYEFGKEQNVSQGLSPASISPYTGNKWGGKYLRAPEIYWKILKKGKGKLVRLGDIAEVRRGFTTGANEFFYLKDITDTIHPSPNKHSSPSMGEDKGEGGKGLRFCRNSAGWEGWIEEEFLKPVIKSPRECKSILINPKDLKYKVLMCHKDKKELKGTYVLKYIEWGEKQEFHKRPSCSGRKNWWDLGERDYFPIIWQVNIRERFIVALRDEQSEVDKMFYLVKPKNLEQNCILNLILNSAITRLFLEVNSLIMMGKSTLAIYMVEDLNDSLVINPSIFDKHQRQKLLTIFDQMKTREIELYLDELGAKNPEDIEFDKIKDDRFKLDDIIFDVLGLTENERREVYWSVCELVKNRLDKAGSV